ncbi:Aphrodisin [Cricetulus griseus]|uniref:Aphrodisin n=1 Tax=Cricetulus griseus TaxID=10029 RepID=G3IMK8_CRIGR|nr:Aphrodisin [Cricetulus griseus]
MVARKRKAGACGHEGSTPSPPSYSAIPVKFTKQQQASHYLHLEGDWVSIAIAADNVEKIENQGTMRLYARQITCHEECDKLEITFYVK